MTTTLPETTTHDFEVFYDGDCPLCMREIRFLQRRDADRQRILFTDITSVDFDAAAIGTSHAELMARIHGRLADGRLVTGVEVFRRLYEAVGFTWSVRVSRLPLIRQLLEVAYVLFAKNRLRLTGRCESGACELDARSA